MLFDDYKYSHIQPLPVDVGGLLLWSQRLVHWGGRASSLATTPRYSMSIEFQAADFKHPTYVVPPFDTRNPKDPPEFGTRIKLIAQVLRKYQHMYGYTDAWTDFSFHSEKVGARVHEQATVARQLEQRLQEAR
eukprot:gnl/TRDRNA2_/TRDRNA2_94933_c1_seq2.p1 gnl/TRDRNA2_/TRDRNA2_94933_c1~~gnl/TRDRNA2_/TRDRNA2_94933_c1_seq2.p1  ORF type:complete len:153 (+),score=11.99 gnl/TRDRNA2_/TRDRNA2_94933_c1_seq2:62-460(+)